MKKTIKIFVLLLIANVLLWGCKSAEDKQTVQDESKETFTDSTKESSDEAKSKADGKERQLLFSYNGLTVSAIDFDTGDTKGLDVLIENGTDKNLTVMWETAVVNNYMVDCMCYESVEAGKTNNPYVGFLEDSIERSEIETIGEIELNIKAYETESMDVFYESKGLIMKTAHYDDMQVKKLDEGEELYNKNGIRIIGRKLKISEDGSKSYELFIENSSDEYIAVSCDNAYVNGQSVGCLLYGDVYSGKMSVDEIYLFSDASEISNIESLEFQLSIVSKETYDWIEKEIHVPVTIK